MLLQGSGNFSVGRHARPGPDIMNKDWIFRTRRDGAPMPASFAAMAGRCGVSPRLARLLWLRGLDRPEAMAEYLSPGLRYLARPALWPGMEQAAGAS